MPAYVFHGSDTLSRKEALDALKASLDSDGALASNTSTFEAASATPGEVIAACSTAPFLGEHRLVIVHGALKGPGGGRRRTKSPGTSETGPWAELVTFAGQMPPTTALVLVDDEAGPLLDLLKGTAEIRGFPAPTPKTLPGWVANRARQSGVKLDARAAKLLAELIGPDPWMLASEIDKLNVYVGDNVVREEDVRVLVSRAKERIGWELADAVVDRQPGKALRILAELLEDGGHEAPLLSTIAGRYRRMAIARDMLDRSEPEEEIARRTGVKYRGKDGRTNYGFTRLLEQAMKYPPSSIRAAYDRLIQAEIEVKSGLSDYRLALEMAVLDLAAPRRGRSRAA
jgi:DNA polymerase-3 subunit delta